MEGLYAESELALFKLILSSTLFFGETKLFRSVIVDGTSKLVRLIVVPLACIVLAYVLAL